MNINPELYIHPTDKAAMNALKAIPGFSSFVKAFMSIWDERIFRLTNMSTNLKLGENQLKKYYDMLLPICQKLGIDVPEIYIKLDVNPNAYTAGDKRPFIVLTSGLFETVPDELIPTVIAHECGHIACHHNLYTTMGQMILNGAYTAIPGLASFVTLPIQVAFSYWMRCSELSADRVATICDGSPDKTIEMCMRFAGFDRDINAEGNIDAFMEQAVEYRELVKNDAWNKTLEFILFNQNSHPLNAVRAYECREWGNSEQFQKISKLLDIKDIATTAVEIPTDYSSKDYSSMQYEDVVSTLRSNGFTNITAIRELETDKKVNVFQVTSVSIASKTSFDKFEWFSSDSDIEIHYFEPETMDEKIAAHGGMHCIPNSAKHCIGRHYSEIINELNAAGFTNITIEAQKTRKALFVKEGAVVQVTVDGLDSFEKDDWVKPDADIRIYYVNLI